VPSRRDYNPRKKRAVFHLLLGVISERGLLAFTPNRIIPIRKTTLKPLKRHGREASKPQSEMTPREWFETKGSKPELREPPKRRHFAV
jgi:hypothetical protein